MSSKAKIGIGITVVAVLIAVFASKGGLLTGRLTPTGSCPKPYHVLTNDRRCVWSCGVGTTPNNRTNECACQSGLVQSGTDSFGRRVCSAPATPPPPPPPPPPPSPRPATPSSAHLSVEHDTVANIRSTQIVAGTTNVSFGVFRFTSDSESVRIRSISLRNIGTNRNGLSNIKFIGTDGSLLGDAPVDSLSPEGNAVLNFSGDSLIITVGTPTSLTLKANTTFDATSGSDVRFVIDRIEATGVDSGGSLAASGITLTSTPTSLKRLYPTKLNFAWIAPASTALITGSQVEVGRFTLGADAANANNPGASISVTALNITELATATLTNFTLHDVTYNMNIATNANSSDFNNSTQGGILFTSMFQQGETRTFKILADVGTNVGSQTAQFRFNAGAAGSPGSATWDVANAGVTSNSTWTVLAENAPDVLSSALIAASVASDTTAPTLNSIVLAETNVGSTTHFDTGDRITLTFSERIDPASIYGKLTYGGTVTEITAGYTGNITSTLSGTTSTYTIGNITNFYYRTTAAGGQNAVTATTVSLSLDIAGTHLTITPTTVTGGVSGVVGTDNAGGVGVLDGGTVVSGTVKDTAGNSIVSGWGPVPTGVL